MRHSNHADRGRRLPRSAVGVLVVALSMIVTACGSGATPPPASSAAPTPVVTPDPHLREPVTADQVYGIFTAAKLALTCPNANLGNGNPRIVKQINCNLAGWPLRITQYKSGKVLSESLTWKPGDPPAGDEAPYNWAGMNVLIQFGPISAKAPAAPEAERQTTAASIVTLLDPLLWPIAQHSVVAIPSKTPVPVATPAPSAKPSTKPAKTPKPTKAP
jgi:hypothetical protein